MDAMLIIELIVLVIIGIPFMIAFIIPLLVMLGDKVRWIPSFTWMLQHYEVDISKPPYCEWMEKSYILFVSLTAIELYTSHFLIKLVTGIKWCVKGIARIFIYLVKLLMKYMTGKWKEWDKELEEEKKQKSKRGWYE